MGNKNFENPKENLEKYLSLHKMLLKLLNREHKAIMLDRLNEVEAINRKKESIMSMIDKIVSIKWGEFIKSYENLRKEEISGFMKEVSSIIHESEKVEKENQELMNIKIHETAQEMINMHQTKKVNDAYKKHSDRKDMLIDKIT